MNQDPVAGKLARFTPSSAGIDRDAILFAAGRASAPRARAWKLAAAALALTQAATLGVWFAGPRHDRPPVASVEQRPEVSEPSRSAEPAPSGSYGDLVRRWERGELPPPAPVEDPESAHPTLSIGAGRDMFDID
jgi:hypothetical protein